MNEKFRLPDCFKQRLAYTPLWSFDVMKVIIIHKKFKIIKKFNEKKNNYKISIIYYQRQFKFIFNRKIKKNQKISTKFDRKNIDYS